MSKGFASMSREKLLAVSRKGGQSVPAAKRAFSNPKVASRAGKRGGKHQAKREQEIARIVAMIGTKE